MVNWNENAVWEGIAIAVLKMSKDTLASKELKDKFIEEAQKRDPTVTWEAFRHIMSRNTMRWTPDVHEDILVAIVGEVKLSGPQMAAVMAALKDKGYSFSEGALRQHIQKLQKKEGTTAGNGNGSAASTPKADSAKKAGTKRKTPAKKKTSKAKVESEEDDDPDLDDFDSDESPLKKLKSSKAAAGRPELTAEQLPKVAGESENDEM